MKSDRNTISLKQAFGMMGRASEAVIVDDCKYDTVLNYDHAVDIVKRFAAGDAVISKVLHEKTKHITAGKYITVGERKDISAHIKLNYAIFRGSKPFAAAPSPYIVLDTKTKILLDQGSGYSSARYLVELIELAQICRVLLADSFPLASERAKASVAELAVRLEPAQRKRFPVFEGEVVALKNLALPSNPCDTRLTDPETLISAYKAEFKRLTQKTPAPVPVRR